MALELKESASSLKRECEIKSMLAIKHEIRLIGLKLSLNNFLRRPNSVSKRKMLVKTHR